MHFLSSALILATEEAEEGGGADLLLPHPDELIAGIAAAIIIYIFVRRWVLPTVNATLEKRQAAIKAEYAAAEAQKAEASGVLADYHQQLAGARDEANRIVEEARQAGEAVRADIVARAEHEAEVIRARAQEELAGERERAVGAMRRSVADLSLDVAERVIGAELDRKAQQALVERYIDELGGVS
jgi:F-type H+-transporting ATPase subunit b